MTSCVMAAKAQERPDPVFVLKLIGDSVYDGGSEECTARPLASDPTNNGVAYNHRGPQQFTSARPQPFSMKS